MNYELLSILILLAIYIIGKLRFQRARKFLSESQNEAVKIILLNARKEFTYAGIILVGLLILGLIISHESSQMIYFAFFAICLIFQIIYFLTLRKKLATIELPDEFVNILSRANAGYLCGLILVTVTFAINLK